MGRIHLKAGVMVLLAAACAGTPEPPAHTVTLKTTFNGEPQNLPWLVFQSGDGPWVTARGDGGSYELGLSDTKYSIVAECPTEGPAYTIIHGVQATVGELPSLTLRCEWRTVTDYIVDLSPTSSSDFIVASTPNGQGWHQAAPGSSSSLPVLAWLSAPTDLSLVQFDSAGVPERIIAKHGVTLDSSGNSFDFDTDGEPATAFPVQLDGAPPATAGSVDPRVDYVSGGGLSELSWTISSSPFEYAAVPDSFATADGIYRKAVEVGYSATQLAGAAQFFADAGAQTIDLSRVPGPLQGTVDGIGTPYARARYSWSQPAQWYEFQTSGPQEGLQAGSHFWVLDVTAGWLDGGTSYTVPDTSHAPGFSSAWTWPMDAGTYSVIIAHDSNRTVADELGSIAAPGLSSKAVSAPAGVERRYTELTSGRP